MMEYIEDITEDIRGVLSWVGYEVKENDSYIINNSIDKVKWELLNKTNQNKIPLGLKHIWVLRSFAEIIMLKYSINQLEIESLKFDRIAKEISEGDTKVVYNDATTTGGEFLRYIENLKGYGDKEIIKYRKIVW